MLEHFWSQIEERIETIDNALNEGMTTKMFDDLYGIQITSVYAASPELVSSRFAQDIVQHS